MRILKLSSTFPAGYLPLNIIGCDFHEKELSPQVKQCWLTITMVPLCFIVTLGFSPLHLKQNREKRQRSLVKKTNELGLLVARCSWFNPEIQNRTISYHDI